MSAFSDRGPSPGDVMEANHHRDWKLEQSYGTVQILANTTSKLGTRDVYCIVLPTFHDDDDDNNNNKTASCFVLAASLFLLP